MRRCYWVRAQLAYRKGPKDFISLKLNSLVLKSEGFPGEQSQVIFGLWATSEQWNKELYGNDIIQVI